MTPEELPRWDWTFHVGDLTRPYTLIPVSVEPFQADSVLHAVLLGPNDEYDFSLYPNYPGEDPDDGMVARHRVKWDSTWMQLAGEASVSAQDWEHFWDFSHDPLTACLESAWLADRFYDLRRRGWADLRRLWDPDQRYTTLVQDTYEHFRPCPTRLEHITGKYEMALEGTDEAYHEVQFALEAGKSPLVVGPEQIVRSEALKFLYENLETRRRCGKLG